MRILLGMPTNGVVHPDAATGFHHPVANDSPHDIQIKKSRGPEVLMNHNTLWADALDQYEAGEIDAFAMMHADVAVEPGWLHVLASELGDADIIGAVIAIKNQTGLTSTAVDDTGDPFLARRLVLKETAQLPPTFTDEDVAKLPTSVPGVKTPLMLNTGLWLVKLGPWCLEELPDGTSPFVFRFHHWIRRSNRGHREGLRQCAFWPDDWNFSRTLRQRANLKFKATTAIRVLHYDGPFMAYPNYFPGPAFGWETDIQNGVKAAWRIAKKCGFALKPDMAGVRAIGPDGKEKTITKGLIEGVDPVLEFDDGTKAKMEECRAVGQTQAA